AWRVPRRADRHQLRDEERATRGRLREDQARRPALLLRRDGAHRQQDRDQGPELADVLEELVDGVGGRGWGEDDLELGTAERGDELRGEPGEERRAEAGQQEDRRDHRQPQRPPLLEQLLPQEHGEPGHRSPASRALRKPRPSISSGYAGPTSSRNT